MKIPSEVASFLLEQAWHFNQSSFIENDPISILEIKYPVKYKINDKYEKCRSSEILFG